MCSIYRSNKQKVPGQLVFSQDMILPINHVADLRYIRQHTKMQIDKYVIRKKTTRINYDYRLGDQVMMGNKSDFKYETPFKGLCKIGQMWINGSFTLKMGAVTTILDIRPIKPLQRQ